MTTAIKTKMSNAINWYENSDFDHPSLKSPQPCPRGIHCDYKIMDRETDTLEPACCRGVHPGEEGTGRRYFPARTVIGSDGQPYEQPACVRLTGASNGFYERRRLRLSWGEWCKSRDIPFIPALPGMPFEPVSRVSFRGHGRVPAKTLTCESLEATLLSGAHSPKRIGISLNRSTGLCTPGCECVFGGECGDAVRGEGSPMLSTEASAVLTPGTPVFPDTATVIFSAGAGGAMCSHEHPSEHPSHCFCPTCRPQRLQEYWDEWAVRILGAREPRANPYPRAVPRVVSRAEFLRPIPQAIPQVRNPPPPTPLNLLPGYYSTEPHEEQSMSPCIPLVPGPQTLSQKEQDLLLAAEQEYKTPTILPSGEQQYEEQD